MSRLYLSIQEYSAKYQVPKSTVRTWIKNGKLNSRRVGWEYMIPDDQPIPHKDPKINKWYWQF